MKKTEYSLTISIKELEKIQPMLRTDKKQHTSCAQLRTRTRT